MIGKHTPSRLNAGSLVGMGRALVRPVPSPITLLERFRRARDVFIGKADALYWTALSDAEQPLSEDLERSDDRGQDTDEIHHYRRGFPRPVNQ